MAEPLEIDEDGSAVAEFVSVLSVVVIVVMALLQLVLAFHVRNTLTDCASEAARYAALTDRGPADGVARARELIAHSVATTASVTAGTQTVDGVQMIEVRVTAPVPVIGLVGPGHFTVVGHGVRDAA